MYGKLTRNQIYCTFFCAKNTCLGYKDTTPQLDLTVLHARNLPFGPANTLRPPLST